MSCAFIEICPIVPSIRPLCEEISVSCQLPVTSSKGGAAIAQRVLAAFELATDNWKLTGSRDSGGSQRREVFGHRLGGVASGPRMTQQADPVWTLRLKQSRPRREKRLHDVEAAE